MSPLNHPSVVPFALFMALLGVRELIDKFCEGAGPFWLAHPEQWIYPLQTLLCGWLLFRHRASYRLRRPAAPVFTITVAVSVLIIWISPQEIFRLPRREEGFDPSLFAGSPPLVAGVIALRFLRLAVVVPLLEEIFWRGFLMRYLIDPRFETVKFGTYAPFAFWGVAVCFGLAHAGPDLVPALITGALYNWIACRTKNLASCVLAHAVTNLLLGFYILATRQWGMW